MMENKGKVYDSQLGISVPSSHIFQNHLDTLLQALLYNSTNVNETILTSAFFLMWIEPLRLYGYLISCWNNLCMKPIGKYILIHG